MEKTFHKKMVASSVKIVNEKKIGNVASSVEIGKEKKIVNVEKKCEPASSSMEIGKEKVIENVKKKGEQKVGASSVKEIEKDGEEGAGGQEESQVFQGLPQNPHHPREDHQL